MDGVQADHHRPFISIPVIVLNDLPNSPDGRQIFVGAHGVDIVQRGRVEGISIGSCEVYPNGEHELAASQDVVQKGVVPGYLEEIREVSGPPPHT